MAVLRRVRETGCCRNVFGTTGGLSLVFCPSSFRSRNILSMKYQLACVPRTADEYRRLSLPELGNYYDWFLGSRQERMTALNWAILESSTLRDWNPDLSTDSVASAGQWFATQVEVRPRTIQEIKILRDTFLPGVGVSDFELTDRTFSLAFDLGVYFGESLRSAYPHLQWKQVLDDKLYVDYGQPVLGGFGRVPLNPFRIAVTFAYGVAGKKQRGDRFLELYLHWEARAATSKLRRSPGTDRPLF
jgi:hypothetical protein